MSIAVTDTQTGQALTVREVTAEVDRLDSWAELTSFGRLYTNEILDITERVAEDVAHALLTGAADLRALANDLAGGRWTYQMDPPPVPVFAELPPDPALQLTPEALDTEHARAMAEQIERRRRMAALAPVGQREQVWAAKPWVPEIPKRSRWQRARTWASGWAEWFKPSGGERR